MKFSFSLSRALLLMLLIFQISYQSQAQNWTNLSSAFPINLSQGSYNDVVDGNSLRAIAVDMAVVKTEDVYVLFKTIFNGQLTSQAIL